MDEDDETQRMVEDEEEEEEDVYEEEEGEHGMLDEQGDEILQHKENSELEDEDEVESNNLEGALEDEDSLVPVTEEDLLSDDSNSLYAETIGFCEPANIKVPLPGFSDKDQNTIFPLVDEQSGILFEIVQELETAHVKSSEQALMLHKDPVAVPLRQLLIPDEGPEIKLRIIEADANEEDSIIQRAVAMASVPEQVNEKLMAAIAKDVFPPEKLALLQEALNKGWRREIVMRSNASPGKKLGDVYYFSPEGMKFRSSKQIDLFLSKKPEYGLTVDNFSFAKSRVSYNPEQETVRQAYGGKSPMLVKAVVARSSPKPTGNFEEVLFGHIENSSRSNNGCQEDPSAARGSSSRRSIQPPKRYATTDNVYHSEKKAKLSAKAQQMKEYMDDGSMEMGMLPPKYPRDMEDSNQTSGLPCDDSMNDFKRRGRPPKPGGRKDMLAQAEAIKAAKCAAGTLHSEEDGALFGISAFTQSAQYGHYSEGMNMEFTGTYSHKQRENEADLEEEDKQQKQDHMGSPDDGLSRNSQVLLPCSIRCPGMTGEIPTLQCRRCLCLYHPGCLGLPNQNYRNFFCSNCEGPNDNARQSSLAANSRSQQQQQFSRRIISDRRGMLQSKPVPSLIRVKPSSQNHESFMRQPSHKMMPRIPNLQPPSSFGRGGHGPGGPRGRMEMVRLNPPSLRTLKRPEAEGRSIATASLPSMDMRRIRGRPVRNMLIPQLNNRSSLTITPISIGRKGVNAPPVPRLQPMIPRLGMARRPGSKDSHPGIKVFRPPTIGGHPSHYAAIRNNVHLQNPYQRQKIPVHQQQRTQIAQVHPQYHHNQGGRGASGVPGAQQQKQVGSNHFKRYAQSVVTINQRKYIAVPKSAAVSTASSNQPENGEEQEESTEDNAQMDEEALIEDESQDLQVDEDLQNEQIDDEIQGEPIDEESLEEDQLEEGNQSVRCEGGSTIDEQEEDFEEPSPAFEPFEDELTQVERYFCSLCVCCGCSHHECRLRRYISRINGIKLEMDDHDDDDEHEHGTELELG